MHDKDPHEPFTLAPTTRKKRPDGRAAGGILVTLGVLAVKFKVLLTGLLSLKWLIFAPKLLFSFGSMFLSVWLYATWFGGWKIGIVFVALIVVHELGHYVTLRNFGLSPNLPMFIPGFGAFVSAPNFGTPAQSVTSSIAGPAFGAAAAAICWAYGAVTHEPFWLVCAYIGFFLNFINLLPIPMLDGGAIAGAIDARLWFVGVPLFLGLMLFVGVTAFSVIFLLVVAVVAVPRLIALWRGELDPRASGLTPVQRTAAGIAYLGLILLTLAGAAVTHIERSSFT
jgi:membrane-associated protease RseP (regulator of RpoE activity)